MSEKNTGLIDEYGPFIAGLLTDAAVGTYLGTRLNKWGANKKNTLGDMINRHAPEGLRSRAFIQPEKVNNFMGNVVGGMGSGIGTFALTHALLNRYYDPLKQETS